MFFFNVLFLYKLSFIFTIFFSVLDSKKKLEIVMLFFFVLFFLTDKRSLEAQLPFLQIFFSILFLWGRRKILLDFALIPDWFEYLCKFLSLRIYFLKHSNSDFWC